MLDTQKQDYEILCEKFRGNLDFDATVSGVVPYSIVETWEDTIAGSNCLIIKDEQDMQALEKKNPAWANSLRASYARNLILYPLVQEKQVFGYLFVTNFNEKKTVESRQLIELLERAQDESRYDFVKDILIPSEEAHIKMYPMDFEEFLWATGNEARWATIREFFDKRKPLGPLVHKMMMNLFRQYIIVGGMPQAVMRFIETKGDFMAVDRVKRGILTLYRDGIHKHAGALAYKVEAVFDTLPAALSRHEKKFKPSDISKDSKLREYEDALFWLKDAMVVNPCYNATEPNVGLGLNLDRTTLKCYMGDTGLLVSLAFGENKNAVADIHRRLLFDKIELNKGMLVENVVAQMLTATGRALYFFTRYDKNKADERMEIDFLIAKSKIGRRKNISPIEVKSGRTYTTVSLDKFRRKYRTYINTPYVLHTDDVTTEDGITYLPLYMTPFL